MVFVRLLFQNGTGNCKKGYYATGIKVIASLNSAHLDLFSISCSLS